jgi:predicted GNAT superfamily acetyltransferase
MSADAIVIRPCRERDELAACVALEKEVWGLPDAEIVPMPVFIVAQEIGGQVIGAFAGADLVGFVMAIPGTRAGKPYLHSHMLAVRSTHRNAGLGQRLKLAQRDEALARGIELVEWTFDPLEIKNAHLNLARLGAIARRYSINHYGDSSSPLQGGLPTDRLVAEWWLRSRRVETVLRSGTLPSFTVEEKVSVPARIYDWKTSALDRPKAAETQLRNRRVLMAAFAQGLAALGFERDADGNGSYLLGRWEENWSYG